jgi:hypothetical protein
MSFFDTEEAHGVMLAYPVMPIFSRRYLLASRDVVTKVGFRKTRWRVPRLPRCKPHLCDYCKPRWYSFLRYRLSKTAMTFFGIETAPMAYYRFMGDGKKLFTRVQ